MHHRSFTNMLLKGWLIALSLCFISPALAQEWSFTVETLTDKLAGATLEHMINLRDPTAGGEDTLTVRYTVPKLCWVAVGVNPTGGGMVNGEVVIGKPSDNTVKKYRMTGKNGNAISELPNQTLINTSLEQTENGETILTFTKLLSEENEYIITMLASNTFIAAFGFSNDFGFHEGYGVENIVLNNIVVSPPVGMPVVAPVVQPTEAPVAAPTEAPVPAPTEAPVAAPTEAPVAAPTEAPVAAPTEAPVAAPTEAPVATPTEAPVAAPTEAPVAAPIEVPAADEDDFVQVPFGGALADLKFRYRLNRNDTNADGADIVTIKMSCPGNVWVGVGANKLGIMVPSKSVIGFPGGDAPPMQYSMQARELTGVTPLPDDEQVLIDPQIVFENDETTLSYTIPVFAAGSGMDEDVEIHADGRVQNIIYACGTNAESSFHQKYGSLSTIIGEADDVPAPITPAPAPTPPVPTLLNFEEVALSGKLEPATFRYAVTRNDPRADGKDTITVEFSCPGEVWVGSGVSQFGAMTPGKAVIGFPGGETPPAQFNMIEKSLDGVTPAPADKQTLIDAQITVTDDKTTLLYTQPLNDPADEDFAIKSDDESNTNFIGACGSAAGPSFHQHYGGFPVTVKDTAPPTDVGFRTVPLAGSLEEADFKYRLNRNDVMAGGADTITIEYSCPGNVWVGVGVSETGAMVPAKGVWGFPGSGNPPNRVFLSSREVPGVNPLPEEEQNLIDPQISFANDRTTMRYTIPTFPSGATTTANMENEALEIHADGRSNNFIGACGTSAGPSFHQRYGPFAVVVEEGETEAPTVAAPFTAPTSPPGFETLELTGDLERSTLSYQINPDDPNTGGKDSITVSYTAPVTGWVSVGASESGLMVGSDAVIGIPATGEVKKYTLSSKEGDLSGVQPMPEEKQTLVNTAITQDRGMTTLTYTKILVEEGEVPINRVGDNIFIAAQGSSNTLGFHAARGAFNLSGKAIERDSSLWAVHGWLAGIAWGILCPLAILAGLFRKGIPGEGVWYKIHRTFQSLVVLLTIASVIVAIAALNKETPSNLSASHFSADFADGHRLIGLFVLILAIIQGANGAMRPHLPAKPEENAGGDDEEGKDSTPPPEEEKSGARKGWEVLHRVLGVGLLALAWYQVHLGIFWYGEFFGSEEEVGGGLASTAFYVVIGILGSLIVIGALMRICMG